jgi:hypothetical protein
MTRSGWRVYQTVAYWTCLAGLAGLLIFALARLM